MGSVTKFVEKQAADKAVFSRFEAVSAVNITPPIRKPLKNGFSGA
jgi:hypothetical protein